MRETAGLIRQTARQALTELRDVIGVLSDAAAAPRTPQPTLGTIPSLVGEYQRAGLKMILSAAGDLRVTGEAPDGAAALAAVTELASELLANGVIEEFTVRADG